MNINEFSEQYRLTVKRDSCNEAIIPGRPRNAARHEDRCHIFEYDGARFSLCLLMNSVGKRNNRKKAAIPAGMTVQQDGTGEGTLLFDPENPQQARLAIELAGARGKRVLIPEEMVILQERGERLAESRAIPQPIA